jgi:hypothetical protein
METCNQDLKPGTREHFLQVTQLQRWGTIQEDVDLCRMRGYFTEAFYRRAVTNRVRTLYTSVRNEADRVGPTSPIGFTHSGSLALRTSSDAPWGHACGLR